MNKLDVLTAKAQVWITTITLVSFIGLIVALMFHAPIANINTHHDLLIGLLSGLGTVLTLQMNFWFARHRRADDPTIPTEPAEPAPLKEQVK